MSANTQRAAAIRARAERLGLEVDSSRPGDGTRRFTFTRASGHTYTVIGARQAEIYLTGFDHGKGEDCGPP